MHIERRKPLTANVGVMSVGLNTYWQQFPGLLDEMTRKCEVLKNKLANFQVNVIDFGMVDCSERAYEVLPQMQGANLDILFVDMTTYATSSTFGAIIRDLTCPVVLVALQPMEAMEYEKGTTFMQLCNDDICSVPEFTGVAIRMNHPVSDVIIGTLENDDAADEKIHQWCKIAHVRHDLRKARLGHLGHVLEAMLDMHSDPTALTAAFGCHIVQCEADSIYEHYNQIDPESKEVKAMEEKILKFFLTPDPKSDPLTEKLTSKDLKTAARAAVALENFAQSKKLDGLAYYYESIPDSEVRTVMTNLIVGNSLLIAQGFPMCGEFDIKTCIAMLIMDRLEIGGSFAEFHPVDFKRDTILVGHDGPHHLNIADKQPVIRSLKKYHGKPGSGASVEFNIKTGPITLLSIGVKADGKLKFIIAEGESIDGPIPPTGNTNTHGKFAPNVRTFLKKWCIEGPTHHFALGIGHHAETIKLIADSFGIESVIVTESI